MKCKQCTGYAWELVWAYALTEEGIPVHMWQCQKCKRVVMASDNTAENERASV